MSSLLLLSPLVPGPAHAYSMPGVGEWVIILLIVLVIFGPSKLPMLGESLGKGIKSFKKAIHPQDEIDVTPPDQLTAGRDGSNTPRQTTTTDDRSRVG